MKEQGRTQKPLRGRWVNSILALIPALGVFALLWFGSRSSPEPLKTAPSRPPVEVLGSQLELRDGRLCLIGSADPFTGSILERYAEGSLKSRSAIVNGLLSGPSEGWYTNGQCQVSEQFRDGVSHGVRTKWYANGNKLSEATIVAGQLQGHFQRWYENGKLAEDIFMREGKADGIAKAYFPSGFLKSQVSLQLGTVSDRKSWADGEIKEFAAVNKVP